MGRCVTTGLYINAVSSYRINAASIYRINAIINALSAIYWRMAQRDGGSAPGCCLKAEAPGSLFTAAQLGTTTESSKIVPNKCLWLSTCSAMAMLQNVMSSCIKAIRWWLDPRDGS